MSTFTSTVQEVIDTVNPSDELLQKKRKADSSSGESVIIKIYDFIKAKTTLGMLDKENGEQFFLLTPLGTDYSSPLLYALEHLIGIIILDTQSSFVNRWLLIGRTQQAVITFLSRASGSIHNTVLSMFME